MDDEKILTEEDTKNGNLTKEDLEYIDKEMNEAVEETIKQVDEEIDKDEALKKEAEELFATDDVNERLRIWKKYHPNEEFKI